MKENNENIKSKSVPIYEQEVVIGFMRDEPFASIYASDTTMITKLDKLCKSSPDMYVLLEDTGTGKRYRLNDKKLVCFRSKKRELTEDQKQKAGERMRKYQALKASNSSSIVQNQTCTLENLS